jgi:hypothetical protein
MDYKNDTALTRFGITQEPGNGLGVAVESMGLMSYQRAYRQVISDGTSVTYPLMMAVIHVTRGKVTVRDNQTGLISGHQFRINTTMNQNCQNFHLQKSNFHVQSINWDDEACVWCTATPSQCGQNVYDYNGVLQESEGKACWLPDEQCVVPSIPNSNSTTTALCELSVRITRPYLYPPIPYICEEKCTTFSTNHLIHISVCARCSSHGRALTLTDSTSKVLHRAFPECPVFSWRSSLQVDKLRSRMTTY